MASWDKIISRGNVEDRRSMVPAIGGLSLTGLALMFLINYLAGGDITDVLSQIQNVPVQNQYVETEEFQGEDSYEVFASTVLGSNNDLWREIFNESRITYEEPRLVLFRQATQSACGVSSSEVGPHYCPLDETIYIDETFFDELERRFGAEGGDVAEAYVISHEVAHHAQNKLGTMEEVEMVVQRNPNKRNDLSIALELQADCYAGIWANYISDQDVLNPGEIREAMDAAAAVGDDRIQEAATGQVNPERWTHGSSDQRVEWFNRGYETADPDMCNTFESL